ncbi:MAG: flagellar FliJ family protein [Dehalococcoidia bacterium]|nr:flagellar FliJ family protein [Dehalococcoidia bacterium]
MKHRERLERLQEGRLAAEMRAQAERQRAVDATRAARGDLFDAGVPGAGPLDPELLASASAYTVRLDREEQARLAALAHSQRQVQAERDVLLEKRRDRKAMDALHEHRVEEERIEQNRLERIRIDEVASTRWQHPGD